MYGMRGAINEFICGNPCRPITVLLLSSLLADPRWRCVCFDPSEPPPQAPGYLRLAGEGDKYWLAGALLINGFRLR